MGIMYNINYLLKMSKSKQAINGAKELVDAGILDEDTIDILRKHDEHIQKVSKEVTDFINTTKVSNKEGRDIKRRIKKTKKEMKRLRKQQRKEFKEKHPYLGSIFGFPIGTILNLPIIGRLFNRIGMQFSGEYRGLKTTIKSLRDQKMENDLAVYEAGEKVKSAQRKLEEYKSSRRDFYDSILDTYTEYKDRIPILRRINLNLSGLNKLENEGKIPTEFVSKVNVLYEQIKNGTEVETGEWHVADFINAIEKLGRYGRLDIPIDMKTYNQLVRPYIDGSNDQSELVNPDEQQFLLEDKQQTESEKPEKSEELEELEEPNEPDESKEPEEPENTTQGKWKGDSLEAPFSNSPLNREILVEMGISDPEQEVKKLGNGSIEKGMAMLEQAVEAIKNGRLSRFKNPTLMEMAQDYCRVEALKPIQEQEEKDDKLLGKE